jgi:hypothetical protein
LNEKLNQKLQPRVQAITATGGAKPSLKKRAKVENKKRLHSQPWQIIKESVQRVVSFNP